MIQQRKPRPGRQRDILAAFTEKVAIQGYDETSLSEIADELQLSKGTIMHHFGSKDRIFRQMALEYMQKRIAELRIIEAEYASPVQRVASIITALVTAFRDDRDATRALSREFMRFVENRVMDDVRAAREEYTAIMRATLEEGKRAGQLEVADSGVVALQLIGMCNWGWTWVDPKGPLSVDEIAEIFVSTFMGGLCANRRLRYRASLPDGVVELRKQAPPALVTVGRSLRAE